MAKNEETNIQTEILLNSHKVPGLTLFRNLVGGFVTQSGGFVKTGLAKGSGDCIGYQVVTITPKMVGMIIAQFVSVEVKTRRRGSEEFAKQVEWKDKVNSRGGKAIVARTVEDLIELLGK